MSYEALTNRGEYLPAHYLAEVFPRDLKAKDGLLARWRDAAEAAHLAARTDTGDEKARAKRATPRAGLAELRQVYFRAKERLKELSSDDRDDALRDFHQEVLLALGFSPQPGEFTMTTATGTHQVPVAHADERIVAVDCAWADDADAASDPDGAGRLLTPVELDRKEVITSGVKLAIRLFRSEKPPLYVLLLGGGMLTLADRRSWGEGRYLAASLDVAFERNDTKTAGELDAIAALLGADSLYEPPEGGDDQLTKFLAAGRQQTVAVSGELREGLRQSVELIANEVLARLREAGVSPEQVAPPRELGRHLTREALRYLYRILFLLYAEARPELGVLPVDHPEYAEGYSLARLGELVTRPMLGERARQGFHLYDSLDLLVRMVNDGHRARGGAVIDDKASENEGIRFEPLKSDLFLPEAITLLGRDRVVHPDDDPDDPGARHIDTRLRNETLREVLRLLMLTKGKKKERGGFISYAQLGINQLGAVYEGLMSYTGFIATEELYEVAKGGDPDKGSWMIPASKADDYADEVFVRVKDDNGKRTGERQRFPKGSFVYRLAGRDRQTSASYYTPQSLTSVTVELALKYRLDQDGTTTPARELLDWAICEPALGSGAFLNEAIDQVAAEYLRRRQHELGQNLDPDRYLLEKQKVKAYIALHNCYGVDLNSTAVELADVSLWLNVMHPGLQAPWFGLHLRRGNSLIGANRRYYLPKQFQTKEWLTATPTNHPFQAGELPNDAIYHFLVPADGWGAAAGSGTVEKEAKVLAPEEAQALGRWRNGIKRAPKTTGRDSQLRRLQRLSRRVEFLWELVRQRLKISEREIRRNIEIWGADNLPAVTEAVAREKIVKDLEYQGTPYWRLKTLMDAWCALWFWPLDKVDLLDGSATEYSDATTITVEETVREPEMDGVLEPEGLFSLVDLGRTEKLSLPQGSRKIRQPSRRKTTAIERLAKKVPLSTLDDWLNFAESLLGRTDLSDDSLFSVSFDNLDDLEGFEDKLPGIMSMDQPYKLAERFPWMDTAADVAESQGFFHWDLTFAQVFAGGGFDLQIGNPPWVRPTWQEASALAEYDPWFELQRKPAATEKDTHRQLLLKSPEARSYVLGEIVDVIGQSKFFSSEQTYPIMVGTQPDVYRAFMAQAWQNSSNFGTSGLIHSGSHLFGENEGMLRESAYQRLRIHGDFHNPGNRFFQKPVGEYTHFSVNVYGYPRSIRFQHLSWLVSTEALRESPGHDGSGEPPAVRYRGGDYDVRPHRLRVVEVDEDFLDLCRRLRKEESRPVRQARLIFPVSMAEMPAIETLAEYPVRLGQMGPKISRGYDESADKKRGLIDYRRPDDKADAWRDIILKGIQLGVASAIFKKPGANPNDPYGEDLVGLNSDFVPATEYVRVSGNSRSFLDAQDRWIDGRALSRLRSSVNAVKRVRAYAAAEDGVDISSVSEGKVDKAFAYFAQRRYATFYRLAWREMIAPNTERSLYAALLPRGVAHLHGVRSAHVEDNLNTALVAGMWASIPVDYMLRISGTGHLDVGQAGQMPAPERGHPLARPLLLRTLRLNCLTSAYGRLWEELYDPAWQETESWACSWPGLQSLGDIGSQWTVDTPLRTERERRSALVEIDALVAVWLGMSADALIAAYRGRFPVLQKYETVTWFDANGWKIAGNARTFGQRQTKEYWPQFQEHLKDPANVPPPEGFTPPFYKADREAEMRHAHAVFSERVARAERETSS